MRPSREVKCSIDPPVTPTSGPVAPAFAIAEQPITPKGLEIGDRPQFASLQIGTTTMSPMERELLLNPQLEITQSR